MEWHTPGRTTARGRRKEHAYTRSYVATDGQEIQWVFIRALMALVADVALFRMQDVLGLGSEARMNKPATPSGNWRWRMREGELRGEHARRLREMAGLYDR